VTTTTTNCVHHWIIEQPKGPYSIQTCKKCGEIDAARNYIGDIVWSRPQGHKVENLEEEKDRQLYLNEHLKEDKEKIEKELIQQEILKAELRKRIPIQYTDAVKTRVLLDLINGKTIAETSRVNKVPDSTIRGWRNLYSNYPKVKISGNIEIFKKIIIKKIGTEGNISDIAKDYDMPRRTLRDWVKKQK